MYVLNIAKAIKKISEAKKSKTLSLKIIIKELVFPRKRVLFNKMRERKKRFVIACIQN